MTNLEIWMEEEEGKILSCTNVPCFASTPKYYKVIHRGREIDFGLCFHCAHNLLMTLPIDAMIEEE